MSKKLVADFVRFAMVVAPALWVWEHYSSVVVGVVVASVVVAVLIALRKQLPTWLGGDRNRREDATRRLYEAVLGGDSTAAALAIGDGADPDLPLLFGQLSETVRAISGRTGRIDVLNQAEVMSAKRSVGP